MSMIPPDDIHLIAENRRLRIEIERLRAETEEQGQTIDRLMEDRRAYLLVKTTDGLTSSEWILREGRAVKRAKQAEARLAKVLQRRGVSAPPCDVCGYDGPNYYQPHTHKCVTGNFERLAVAQPEEEHIVPDAPSDPIGMGWVRCVHGYWLPSLDLCPQTAAQPEEPCYCAQGDRDDGTRVLHFHRAGYVVAAVQPEEPKP